MSELPPNDELRALIALEKGAVVDPGPAREHLAARLASQLPRALVATPRAEAPSPRRAWWQTGMAKGVGLFAAGAVAGAGARSLSMPPAANPEIRYVDRIVEVVRSPDAGAVPEPSTVSSAPTDARPTASVSPRLDRPAPSATASTAASSPDEALSKERQMVEKARSALARRDAASALAAVDEHARAFPHGQLTEMCEAVAVQALVSAGRNGEARARAARFDRVFPSSVYRAVVDGAISSIP